MAKNGDFGAKIAANQRGKKILFQWILFQNEDCILISWKSWQSKARCAGDRMLSNLRWNTRFPPQHATDCPDFHEIKECQNQNCW